MWEHVSESYEKISFLQVDALSEFAQYQKEKAKIVALMHAHFFEAACIWGIKGMKDLEKAETQKKTPDAQKKFLGVLQDQYEKLTGGYGGMTCALVHPVLLQTVKELL